MREVKAMLPEAGVSISKELVLNVMYADDTQLVEISRDGLERLACAVKDVSSDFRLKINIAKINVMAINGREMWNWKAPCIYNCQSVQVPGIDNSCG